MRSIQLAVLVILLSTGEAATPVLQVERSSVAGSEQVRHGGFETLENDLWPGWHGYGQGFEFAPDEGRNGSAALRCTSPSGSGQYGASQTLLLNQTQPVPIVISGWSRAENVTGAPDNGYSIYVDLRYTDGTPLWGQTGNFRCGTHDWEQRRFVVVPEKPVASLTVYGLFRGHGGTAWFDDLSVQSLRSDEGATLFQNVPVRLAGVNDPNSRAGIRELATDDGLKIATSDRYALRVIRLADGPPTTRGPFGLLARDAAADSDFYALPTGDCPELQLSTRFAWSVQAEHLALAGRITDLSHQDRAITLVFAVPLDALGWQWGDDFRRSRLITGNTEYVRQVSTRCGSTGTISLYPLAAVWNEQAGLALALDMGQPAVYRVGYHAGLRCLFITYDFGLVPETEAFPSAADFRFVLYRFEPRWGFRAAWQKFMRIFPAYFEVRCPKQGLWMPFTDVSSVAGWQDFGFRFHEGNNNVPWDDDHGILSFRYTEPMTWWMPMPAEAPRTFESALQIQTTLEETGNRSQRRMATVSRTAAMHTEDDQPALQFRDTPWCDGAVWSLNPNPHLGRSDRLPDNVEPTNAATVHWNRQIKESLYGPAARGELDGEYLDSLEGYVTAELNFRRAHFRTSTVPLTFATETHRPALFKGLTVFEFTRWIAEDLRRLGKLTFANSVPYRFTYLCPWLDVLGTETDWMPGGRYQPTSDEQMLLWRGLAGGKPYLLLMNTDYDRFTPEWVERYFQRALFYGMWPGFFSHNAAENPYWKNPGWYERDRPLFKRYIPLIRQVAEAGWHPVTHATARDSRIHLERFGPDAAGRVFITLHNASTQAVSSRIRIDTDALRVPANAPTRELVRSESFPWPKSGWPVTLKPQTTQVLQLPGD